MSSGQDSADRQRWTELKSLFNAAFERPPEEWPALVADLRRRDPELADQLERLLDGHREALIDVDPRGSDALAPGAAIGPYVVVELIGEGGMGRVYRARDARLGRDVAIKVLPPDYAHDPARRTRMEREARAMGMLSHPNLVTVHDIGDHRGSPFIVSELLEGETLRERITGAGGATAVLDPDTALDIVAAVADALGAAHARRIVHRDIKPENVFLTSDGRVKVLDFGIAKLVDGDGGAEATATGAIIGTLGYITPEQLRGDTAGPASDVYACGVVLYELLAGARPFAGLSQPALIGAILHQPAPALAGVPPAVGALVARCLAKEAAARPASGAELAAELRSLRDGLAVPADDPREWPTRLVQAPPAAADRATWRRPIVVASGLGLLALLAGAAAWQQQREAAGLARVSPAEAPAPTPRPEGSARIPESERAVPPTPSAAGPASSPPPVATETRTNVARQPRGAGTPAAVPPASGPAATSAPSPPPTAAPQAAAPPLDGIWSMTEAVAEAAHGIACKAEGALQLKAGDGVLDGTIRLKQTCQDGTGKTDSLESTTALTAGAVVGDAVSFVTRSDVERVVTTCRYSGRVVGSAKATMTGEVECDLRDPASTIVIRPVGSWRAQRTPP